ncbi:hypothetical protein D3C81_2026300 [compost metagenome]
MRSAPAAPAYPAFAPPRSAAAAAPERGSNIACINARIRQSVLSGCTGTGQSVLPDLPPAPAFHSAWLR